MLESQHKSQHIKRWNQNTRKTPQNTPRSLLTRWPAIKIAGRMELKMINTPRGLAIWNQNLKQLWVRGALRVCSNKDDIAKSHSLTKDNNKSQSKKVGLSKQDIYNNSRVPRKTSPTNPDQLVKNCILCLTGVTSLPSYPLILVVIGTILWPSCDWFNPVSTKSLWPT